MIETSRTQSGLNIKSRDLTLNSLSVIHKHTYIHTYIYICIYLKNVVLPDRDVVVPDGAVVEEGG